MKENDKRQPVTLKRKWPALIGIAAIPLILITLFAWSSGWINIGRITSKQIYDDFNNVISPFPSGYRRAHGKGICFTGVFRSNPEATQLSKARVFTQKDISVIGRFSVGAGNPHVADGTARVTSMAFLIKTDDGQEWRSAMNSVPYFHVATAEGFYAGLQANHPDPKTGKPDPKKLDEFHSKYPESVKFEKWAATAPWPDSYSGASFNSVNSFRFISESGKETYVRWVMRPRTPMHEMTEKQRKEADPNFLDEDLIGRLKSGPVYWDMVATIAEPGDAVNDSSQPWPSNRKQMVIGTIEVTSASKQSTGECRDINYDPTIVPAGIEISNDPILRARSGAYSHSFNARLHEIGTGKASKEINGKK